MSATKPIIRTGHVRGSTIDKTILHAPGVFSLIRRTFDHKISSLLEAVILDFTNDHMTLQFDKPLGSVVVDVAV